MPISAATAPKTGRDLRLLCSGFIDEPSCSRPQVRVGSGSISANEPSLELPRLGWASSDKRLGCRTPDAAHLIRLRSSRDTGPHKGEAPTWPRPLPLRGDRRSGGLTGVTSADDQDADGRGGV